MQQGHCDEGSRRFLIYKQRAMELLGVETYKRYAVSSASRAEWLQIARSVELAKAAYDEARHHYLDHTIDCDRCEKDLPAFVGLGEPGTSASTSALPSASLEMLGARAP